MTAVLQQSPVLSKSALAQIDAISNRIVRNTIRTRVYLLLVGLVGITVGGISLVAKISWNGTNSHKLTVEEARDIALDEWTAHAKRVTASFRLRNAAMTAINALADLERSSDEEIASKAKLWRSQVKSAIESR